MSADAYAVDVMRPRDVTVRIKRGTFLSEASSERLPNAISMALPSSSDSARSRGMAFLAAAMKSWPIGRKRAGDAGVRWHSSGLAEGKLGNRTRPLD